VTSSLQSPYFERGHPDPHLHRPFLAPFRQILLFLLVFLLLLIFRRLCDESWQRGKTLQRSCSLLALLWKKSRVKTDASVVVVAAAVVVAVVVVSAAVVVVSAAVAVVAAAVVVGVAVADILKTLWL
jgi:hypothetical protein